MSKNPEGKDDTFFDDLSKRLAEIGEDDEAESETGPEEATAQEDSETSPEEPYPDAPPENEPEGRLHGPTKDESA